MYPIYSPVVNPITTLLSLGALERSVSVALNTCTNSPSGLMVPMIPADWGNIAGHPIDNLETIELMASLRRLHDEAEGIASRFRDLQDRTQRETQRETQKTRISSTFPAFNHPSDQDRLRDMIARLPMRQPSSPDLSGPAARSGNKWYLGLTTTQRGQNSPFVNDDGRSIHLHQVLSDRAVIGYGWRQSLMHYVELLPNGGNRMKARSVALFSDDEALRTDFGVNWFQNMLQSMIEFYSTSFESFEGNILFSGTDRKHQPISQTLNPADSSPLTRLFRDLDLAKDFTFESEKVVEGSRNPALRSVGQVVPLASVRFSAGNTGQARLQRAFYRPTKSNILGEQGLSHEQRVRLQFPRTPSRPPTRPSRVP